jgi:outer membrane lipase/esterase
LSENKIKRDVNMKSVLLASVALGVLLSASPVSAQQYSRAIIFGDSLSDNGNIATANGGVVPNYLPITVTRFSNGPVWSEQVFGPATNFFTTVNPNTGNVDYAFGGSRTTGAQTPGPTTQQQIGTYLLGGGTFQPRDVVTLWAGANNIFQGLPVAAGDPATALAVMTGIANGAATDVSAQVAQLAGAGARTILVPNLPNFGTLPQFAGTAAAGLAGASTSTFNATLATNLAATAAANPNANIISFNVSGLLTAVQASPGAFGFANASAGCVLTAACAGNPATWNTFAFWDGVHPTQAGHAVIAQAAALYLTAPTRAAELSNAMSFTAFGARRTAILDSMSQLAMLSPAPGKWEYFAFVTGEAAQANGASTTGLLTAGVTTNGKAREYNLGGLRFGGLYNVGNGWTVGAMASATTGKLEGVKGKFEAGATQISADLIARWRAQNGFFVNLGLGFGVDSFSDYKLQTVGPLLNKASVYGQSMSATTEAGYDFNMGATTLTPQVRASYIRTNVEGYRESGIVAPLAFGSRTVDGLAGAAEIKISYQFSQAASVYALVGYESFLAASGGDIKARIAGNTSLPIVLKGSDPVNQGVVFGAGAAMNFGTWTGRVAYRGSVGASGFTTHAANLSASMKF